MRGADEFGPSFQRTLVRATLTDPGLRTLVQRFTSTGQLGFTDPTSAWAWSVVSREEHPTLLQLETEAYRLRVDDPARLGLSAVMAAAPDAREDDYVRRAIVEWARRQVFAVAFDEARQAWNAGDVDKAYTTMVARMEELGAIRLEAADRGWFFEEVDQRQMRRWSTGMSDPFPIGIRRLDAAMHGGLYPGELEVPLAYSGVGKTFWCVQRGFIATRMRRRVLHYVLEGGRSKTEDRYESRFAYEVYSAVRRGDIDADKMAQLRREYAILREGLVIRGYADRRQWRITFDDILGELGELRRSRGWVPELVVVDYGDLVHAPGDDEKTRQKNAFQQLKTLAERQEFRGHLGYAVCSPSQAQRPGKGADEKEHFLRPRDIADAYDKVRIADVIPSINRTLEEKKKGWARVLLGKYRDDEDGLTVKVRTDYQHGGFCHIGIELDKDGVEVGPKDEDDEPPPAPGATA